MNLENVRDFKQALQTGNLNQAQVVVDALEREAADPSTLNVMRSRIEGARSNHAKAIELLHLSLDQNPANIDAYLSLTTAYTAQKDLHQALETAQRANDIQPDTGIILNNLGLAYFNLKLGDEARACFTRAIELDPNAAALHRHLGMTLVGLSLHTEARQSLEHALKLNPNDVPSHVHLASLHLRHDRPEIAERHALAAIKLQPNNAEAHFFLGRSLALTGREDEAAQSFKTAASLSPELLNAQGIWYIEEGQLEAAHKNFAQKLSLDPLDGLALHYLIETQGRPATPEQMESLEKAARQEGDTPESYPFANYSLGKVLEKHKDFERSMHCYNEANSTFFSQKLKHQKDLVSLIDEEVELAKRLFTKETVSDLRKKGLQDERPIFIIGMIRSGTTLLEQIISNHSSVGPAGELRYWMENGPAALRNLDNLDKFTEEYLNIYDKVLPGMARVTDKMPLNLRFLGLISCGLPLSKIVWIKRDPMDTCFSIYTTPFTDPPIFSYNLYNIGYVFRKYMELMEHWKAVLPEGTFYEVQYEELVSNQEEVTRGIFDYLGLPFEEATLSPESNSAAVRTPSSLQVRKPVYTSSVARWKNYEPWLGDLKRGLGLV